jgi:MFS transporter, ACS family, glucarate transporter
MPARHRLILLTFLLSVLLYIDRIAISTAKVPITAELGLADTQFGWVLSAFALGYALFQTPAGYLADRLGPRTVMTLLVLLWSVFTALTGLATGFVALLVYRFVFGAGEAGAYPTCARAFYAWLPTAERGLAQGINFSGARLGAAFALPGIAWMVERAGWRTAFFILGVLGVVYALVWFWWFRDRPEDHPGVSEAERRLIAEGRESPVTSAALPLTPRVLMSSRNMRVAMGQYFASNFTFFFCLTWLFPYLQQTFALTATRAAFLAAVPLLAGAAGNWGGGWLVDSLYKRSSKERSRQIPAILGFSLAATGLAVSLIADDLPLKVLSLSVAVFGADMTLPPSWAFCIDIGRHHSGAVSGTMNMAGNVGSFVTSLAFPYLLLWTGSPDPFFIVGAVLNVTAIWLWTLARPAVPVVSS